MKVVINECFGGFGLSAEAMKLLVTRGSKAVKKEDEVKYHGGQAEWDKGKKKYPTLYEEVDIGDGWRARGFCGRAGDTLMKDGFVYNYKDEERDDPDLIDVVESLGSRANGECAELAVVEIPDGTKYVIEEYDGLEHIAEAHQTWS